MMFAWKETSGQSRAFSLQWQIRASTPVTDTTRTRTFQVIELDDADLKLDLSSTASASAGASYADVTGLSSSFTTASGAIHLVLGTMTPASGADRTADFRIGVDATEEGAEVTSYSDATNECSGIMLAWVRTGLSAASHTFSLRWKNRSGSVTADTGRARTLQVIELTGDWNRRINQSSTAAASSTASFADITDMSGAFTPQGSTSVTIVTFAGNPDDAGGTLDAYAAFRFTRGGAQMGAEVISGADTTDMVNGVFLSHAISSITGLQTFAVQWKTVDGACAADTSRIRILQALEWDSGGAAPTADRATKYIHRGHGLEPMMISGG
jgi:hypothetical protein